MLFAAFLRLGLLGFGGVLPWARRVLVEERRWLSAAEFTDLLALCQFLPGPNICNLSVALGLRHAGAAGAGAALAGLLLGPMAVVLALGGAYARWGGLPVVGRAFAGLAAAASGLVLATALRIAGPIRGNPRALAVAGAAFALVALLRQPLLPTMLALAPLSIALVRSEG